MWQWWHTYDYFLFLESHEKDEIVTSSSSKTRIKSILVRYFDSPEYERIDGVKDEKVFIVRPLPWRAGRYNGFVEKLDREHKKTASARSKFRILPRKAGVNSDRLPPSSLKDCYKWVFKTTNWFLLTRCRVNT